MLGTIKGCFFPFTVKYEVFFSLSLSLSHTHALSLHANAAKRVYTSYIHTHTHTRDIHIRTQHKRYSYTNTYARPHYTHVYIYLVCCYKLRSITRNRLHSANRSLHFQANSHFLIRKFLHILMQSICKTLTRSSHSHSDSYLHLHLQPRQMHTRMKLNQTLSCVYVRGGSCIYTNE